MRGNVSRGLLVAWVLSLIVGTQGCGIYSIHFDPPRASPVVSRHPPLDLTLSLGDVQFSVNGKPVPLDAAALKRIDDSFVQRATASRLVRAVHPRGTTTDLYYDMSADLNFGGIPSLARSLYQLVAFVPALIIPGFPYPWQFHRRDTIRIRGGAGQSAVALREYTISYTMAVWGGTIWAATVSNNQIEAAEYLIDSVSDAVGRDYETFHEYGRLVKTSGVPSGTEAQQVEPSWESTVVRITSTAGIGSGFFVTKNRIATNAHVVGDDSQVGVALGGGRPISVAVVYRSTDLDFALLQSPVESSPFALRSTPLVDGENVMALGFPQGRRLVAASTGTIREIVECCVVHDALIAAGSSGGPLLDANSQVVGINTALSKVRGDRVNATDRSFAVKMSFILEVLASLSSTEAETTPTFVPQREVPHHDVILLKGCSPDSLGLLRGTITEAINTGAPLYNRGDAEGCFRLYERVAVDLTDRLKACPGAAGALREGVERARTHATSFEEKAWALRDAFDGLLDVVARYDAASP